MNSHYVESKRDLFVTMVRNDYDKQRFLVTVLYGETGDGIGGVNGKRIQNS